MEGYRSPLYKCAVGVASFEPEIVLRNVIFEKYKTFSVLIYSYINTRGNRKNENFLNELQKKEL